MKMKIEWGHFHISHIFFPLKYHFGGKSHRYFFLLKSIKVKKGKKKLKILPLKLPKMEARRGSNWPREKKPFKESSKTQLLPHPNQKKVAAFVKAASSSIFHLSEFSTASIPSSQIHRHRIVSRYSPMSFSQILFFFLFFFKYFRKKPAWEFLFLFLFFSNF